MKLVEVGDETCVRILYYLNQIILGGCRGILTIDVNPTRIDITPSPRIRILEDDDEGRTYSHKPN